MVVSRKDSPKCELETGDIKIKQVKKFSYLGSMLTEDGNCDTEIQRRFGIAKGAFQKLSKVLTNRTMTIKTRKRVLDCYLMTNLLYASECWTISAHMRSKLEAAEMWFYRRMLKIPWTDHVTNEEVLKKIGTKRKLLTSVRKRLLEFLGHVMRKESLENLTLTGHIEGKKSRGRPRIKYLNSLSTWMAEQVREGQRGGIKEQELLKNKGKKDVESHDRPRLERIWQLKREREIR